MSNTGLNLPLLVRNSNNSQNLGEMAGFGVSIAKLYGNDIYTAFTSRSKLPIRANSTTLFNEAIYSDTGFTHDNFHQFKVNEAI